MTSEEKKKTMVATRPTSFMVSYRYYSSDLPASDPIPVVDGLSTFQDAAKYALAIHSPGYYYHHYYYYYYGGGGGDDGWGWGWTPCTLEEKWDLEAGRATLRYEHRSHSTAAAFEITIHPSPTFKVSLCWFIDGLPATTPVFVRQGLDHFDDAVEDARQVLTTGDEWSLKGIEVWDRQNGCGSIRYYHLEDDEFFEVLVSRD